MNMSRLALHVVLQGGDCLRMLIYKLSGPILAAIFIAALLLANSTFSAEETKPDFTGATNCACSIQTTTDTLGHLNGYLVRLDIQYLGNLKPRWNQPMRMYRVEDRKKAGEFCISMYKQFFKEEQKQYEALQRQTHRDAASKTVHEAAIKNSLDPAF
jgi:hypothetical protein